MAPVYERINGNFDATPLTRSLRQEVEGFEEIVCLMELIDNSVEATIDRAEPTISIQLIFNKVDEHGRPTNEGSQLIIEDNGKGMSRRQLVHYFRVSYTTSHIPSIDRESHPGVLPLSAFINPKLNRFGRGSASVVYFGDMVEIESFQAPQDPLQPSRAYKVRQCDYGALLRTNNWTLDMYEKDQEVVEEDLSKRGMELPRQERRKGGWRGFMWGGSRPQIMDLAFEGPETAKSLPTVHSTTPADYKAIAQLAQVVMGDGWTIIRISQLLPEKERVLQDVLSLEQLAKRLQQAYHWFIYGVPEVLWNKLPPDLTRGCSRPKGGLKIEISAYSANNLIFQACLSRDSPTGPGFGGRGQMAPGQSDLQAVLKEWEELTLANRHLEPCVTCMRYLPPGHPTPGAPCRPLSRFGGPETKEEFGAKSGGSAGGGRGPGPGGGVSAATSSVPALNLLGRGRGGSGALPPRPPGSVPVGPDGGVEVIELLDEDETDIDRRQKDCVCDFVLIWLFFPYRACARSKPLGDGGHELFVFPFWSGKDMIKSKLHGQFPEIYKAAVALARSDQEVQNHAHKLEDPGRLVALLLVSPDALAHQHKSDFEGKAYELFCKAGPSQGRHYRPSSGAQPRLMTYVWQKDLEGAGGDGAGAGASTDGTCGSAEGSAGGSGRSGGARRGRRSGANALILGSPGRPPPLPQLGHAGWYEDLAGGWAAQQLVGAFHAWFLTDEDGHLVNPRMEELAALGLPEPHGFNLAERGYKECGDKYSYGEGDPVEKGEMPIRSFEEFRVAERTGEEEQQQEEEEEVRWARRPAMRQEAEEQPEVVVVVEVAGVVQALLSESIMELQPLGRGVNRLAVRRGEQSELIHKWEGFLPRMLAVEPDAQMGPLRDEYDINHAFNSITVYIAGNGTATGECGGASGSGGAAAGAAGGSSRGRGRTSKAAQGAAAGPGASTLPGAAAAGAAGPSVSPHSAPHLPCADMSKTQAHYPHYSVAVALVIEQSYSGKSHALGNQRYTFTGFGKHIRQPGKYRFRFVPEETAVALLDTQQELTYEFRVTSTQPAALDACFVLGTGREPVTTTPLPRPPVVRLGDQMPDLAVTLLDSRGGKVAFSPELRARLETPWEPSAGPGVTSTNVANANGNNPAVGSGGGEGHPLTITAEVVNGDPLRFKLRLVKRGGGGSGATAAGGGATASRPLGLSFSPDGMVMFLSGLYVQPLALKQTEGSGKGNVPSLMVRLKVAIKATAADVAAGPAEHLLTNSQATVGGGGAGGSRGAAATAASSSGTPELTLVSGPPAVLTVEGGNWFNFPTLEKPLTLSKGAELDNSLVIRLEDASGNPYYLASERSTARSARPRVEIRCSRLDGADGSQAPPVMFRKQVGTVGGSGGAGRGGGARGEFAESAEIELDSSGNFLTLPGNLVKATGLPGDMGALTLSLVESGAGGGGRGVRGGGRCPRLMSYVSVRKVVLGVEDTAADEDGDGGGIRGSGARARPAHAHVREYLLDGTVHAKKRGEVLWGDLEAVPPSADGGSGVGGEEGAGGGGKSLLETAFERRIEFTSLGPREVFLRPSGAVLRGRDEVLEAARQALAVPAVLYEQCFVLRPGQLRLGGLRLSLSDEADDVVDELLTADVRIMIGSRDAVAGGNQRLRFEKGRVELPELVFEERDFTEAAAAAVAAMGSGSGSGAVAASHFTTVAVTVRDAEIRGGTSAAAPPGRTSSFCYGTFFVRQEPYPAALRLAPLTCDLLTGRRAVTPWPPLPPLQSVEGLLQLPPAAVAAAAAQAAAGGGGRQRAGSARSVSTEPAAVAVAAGGGSGRAPPWVGAPELLLQLRSSPRAGAGRGGGGAGGGAAAAGVVDASALMAQGFSLAPVGNITLQAGQALQVPLVAVDQMGFPVPMHRGLVQLLEMYTKAYVEPAQDAASAAAAAAAAVAAAAASGGDVFGQARGGGGGGGAAAISRTGRSVRGSGVAGAGDGSGAATGGGIVPCVISGWTWPEEEEGENEEVEEGGRARRTRSQGTAPVAGEGALQPPRLPVCFFQVHPAHHPGHAGLVISFEPPPDAAVAAAAAAAVAAADGCVSPPLQLPPAVPLPRLHLGFALHFTHGPLAPGGYQLAVLAPEGVQAQPISEHLARDAESSRLLQPPLDPTSCRIYRLDVVEQSSFRLELRLMDAQSCLVAEDGAFELRYLTSTTEQHQQLRVESCSVTRGSLSVSLPVGAGRAWRSCPKLLLLSPTSPNFAHGGPLCIYVTVRPGRYPVEPLELIWAEGVKPPRRNRPIRLTLSNDDPPATHGSNDDNVHDEDDNGVLGMGSWPRLPPFRVLVHSADGAKFEAEELRPLRLYYTRRGPEDASTAVADGGGGIPAPDQPVTLLGARKGGRFGAGPAAGISYGGLFYAAAGRVALPTRVGVRWSLMAAYEDPRVISSPNHRLRPLRILDLELLPAPPAAIQLSPAVEAALGPTDSRYRAVVVSSEGLGEHSLPELEGRLVDRWGNAAKPQPVDFMVLMARTSNAAGGPCSSSAAGATAAMTIELSSCELDAASGTFHLAATSLSAAAGLMTPGSDYEVWLQLWRSTDGGGKSGDVPMTTAEGQEEDAEGVVPGAVAVPGMELLVRTLYVSMMGDSGTLRTQVQRLQAEVAHKEGQVRAADVETSARRREAAAAASQYGHVLAQLQRRGVQLPRASAAAAAAAAAGRPGEAVIAAAVESEYRGLADAVQSALTFLDGQAISLMRPPLVEPAPPITRWAPPNPHAAGGAAAAAQMGHPTLDAGRVFERLRQMASACAGLAGALGPLVMLGAVERHDVGVALGQLAGGRFERVFVMEEEALREVAGRLRSMRPGGSATDLRDPGLLTRYDLDQEGVDTSHPQLLLTKRQLRNRFQARCAAYSCMAYFDPDSDPDSDPFRVQVRQGVLNFDPDPEEVAARADMHHQQHAVPPSSSRQQRQQPKKRSLVCGYMSQEQQQEDEAPRPLPPQQQQQGRGGNGGPHPQSQSQSHGFIGFAVNLVHLPPHLADIRVALRDSRGQLVQATLRQTMLNYVYGNAMVFEGEEHIMSFRDRCRRAGVAVEMPLIAVDGRGGYNLADRGSVSFGERLPPHVCFSGLSPGEITPLSLEGVHGGALDGRLRAEQLRLRHLQYHKAQLQSLLPQLQFAFNDLRAKQHQVEELSQTLRVLRETMVPELDELQDQIRNCTAELERVAQRERFQAAQRQQQQRRQGQSVGGMGGAEGRAALSGRRGLAVRFGRAGGGGGEGLTLARST
ncbi:hypothetical protein VOLCADRAFT_88023 [Volvox carteri f. nagariensis]|uniref:Uncharacterized protein n=1 Tax=Volvox carteri f. nagariensis TaxID=3068 RepID=D8TMV5_VOLCA|nr:uncharacterized protein VOLCADRAFT_88023 [Volvox carteri f. nagariensis]EFJ51191.1 hypothetical protein VOLCADRAFT_88023 [Volvox carteri f. nagariensis]|eukprot:XP_002947658.1 hypothetical protein VOLCADRAFT_88023 [Volvox carteri f. nagariensis]